MAESPKFSRLKGNLGRGTRWWREILDRNRKYGRFAHAQWKICNIALIYGRICEIFALFRKSGSRNTMVTSDFSPEVEIRPFRACAMHPAIITGTFRSLLTWLWGRYHVPQKAFLVLFIRIFCICYKPTYQERCWASQRGLLSAVSVLGPCIAAASLSHYRRLSASVAHYWEEMRRRQMMKMLLKVE